MTTTAGTRIIRPNINQIIKMGQGKAPHPSRPSELRKIAVADDDLQMANIVARSLKKMTRFNTIRMETATSGELGPSHIVLASYPGEIDGLAEFMLSRQADMLLTDNDMYRDDRGLEITAYQRKNDYAGWIIGMTGMINNVDAFIKAGADLAFHKRDMHKVLINLFVLE